MASCNPVGSAGNFGGNELDNLYGVPRDRYGGGGGGLRYAVQEVVSTSFTWYSSVSCFFLFPPTFSTAGTHTHHRHHRNGWTSFVYGGMYGCLLTGFKVVQNFAKKGNYMQAKVGWVDFILALATVQCAFRSPP